jgi:hypothetical protein
MMKTIKKQKPDNISYHQKILKQNSQGKLE